MRSSPSAASPTHSPAAALADSSARLLIPLSPRPASAAEPAESSPRMLIDYLSRLARFEPRLAHFRRLKTTVAREPVQAFMGQGGHGRPGVATPSPAPTPTGSDEPGSGFSLADVERWVLSKVWGTEAAAARPPVSRDDSQGLDVDLSAIFTRKTSSTSVDDVVALVPSKPAPRFLNYYTPEALILALESTGILAALAKKGYEHPSLVFDCSDEFQHRLSLVDSSLFGPGRHLLSSEAFLIDLYMKRRRSWTTDSMVCYQLMKRLEAAGSWEELRARTGEIRSPYVGLEGAREVSHFLEANVPKYGKLGKRGGEWDVSELAWMQMHDPFAPITRPLLPGQRFPGLGLGRQVAAVMEGMAEHSKVTDALLNFPFHYHNAVSYSVLGYRHLDPIYSAYFDWFSTQLRPPIDEHGFCFVAWCVSMGHVRRITEQLESDGRWTQVSSRLERWSASEQIYPTGSGPQAFLDCPEWERLNSKYADILSRDGGANMEGVSVVANEQGRTRRSTLVIDLEGCPELWQYSKIWYKRDPETGVFL